MKLTFAGASGPWRRCSRQVSCVSSSWPRCAGPSPSWRPPRRPRSHCGLDPPWETIITIRPCIGNISFGQRLTSCPPVCPASHLTAKGSPQGPGNYEFTSEKKFKHSREPWQRVKVDLYVTKRPCILLVINGRKCIFYGGLGRYLC